MTTTSRLAMALLVLPLALVHCASDPASDSEAPDSPDLLGSSESRFYACLMTSGQVRTCVEDDNLTRAQVLTAARRCTSSEERTAVKVDSCPTEDQVGSCIAVAGPATQTFIYYADGGVSTEVAQQSCQSVSGMFVR